MATEEILPWEKVEAQSGKQGSRSEQLRMLVDLRRCIGCHACSVACKTEHNVPLGSFRMRVRWLPRPDVPTIAFVPLFDDSLCDFGSNRRRYGMQPACVDACPTTALIFGDVADRTSEVSRPGQDLEAKRMDAPDAGLKQDVLYIGVEEWMPKAIHRGCRLDQRDEDLTYEQR